MVWRFWPPKTKPRPQGCSFPGTADVPGGSSTGGGGPPDVREIGWVFHHEQHGNRCPARRPSRKTNAQYAETSFWREIRSSAFASQDRLYSTSLSAPPSRQNQLQVDGGLRWDIEQCPPASYVPRSARRYVHCRLLRALLARAYCQPVLVACSRSAAVGRTARRLAVGNARYLPYFLQNALLVASISLYKLTS